MISLIFWGFTFELFMSEWVDSAFYTHFLQCSVISFWCTSCHRVQMVLSRSVKHSTTYIQEQSYFAIVEKWGGKRIFRFLWSALRLTVEFLKSLLNCEMSGSSFIIFENSLSICCIISLNYFRGVDIKSKIDNQYIYYVNNLFIYFS